MGGTRSRASAGDCGEDPGRTALAGNIDEAHGIHLLSEVRDGWTGTAGPTGAGNGAGQAAVQRRSGQKHDKGHSRQRKSLTKPLQPMEHTSFPKAGRGGREPDTGGTRRAGPGLVAGGLADGADGRANGDDNGAGGGQHGSHPLSSGAGGWTGTAGHRRGAAGRTRLSCQ